MCSPTSWRMRLITAVRSSWWLARRATGCRAPLLTGYGNGKGVLHDAIEDRTPSRGRTARHRVSARGPAGAAGVFRAGSPGGHAVAHLRRRPGHSRVDRDAGRVRPREPRALDSGAGGLFPGNNRGPATAVSRVHDAGRGFRGCRGAEFRRGADVPDRPAACAPRDVARTLSTISPRKATWTLTCFSSPSSYSWGSRPLR